MSAYVKIVNKSSKESVSPSMLESGNRREDILMSQPMVSFYLWLKAFAGGTWDVVNDDDDKADPDKVLTDKTESYRTQYNAYASTRGLPLVAALQTENAQITSQGLEASTSPSGVRGRTVEVKPS